MHKILILNGPNLNMLGKRDPKLYGSLTLNDIQSLCEQQASKHNFQIDFRQSNHEGELVGWIQDIVSDNTYAAVLINAGAYTHTSVALHDALELLSIPVIEVHLSNPKDRETFRHQSYIEPIAEKVFAGLKEHSYIKAIDYVISKNT